MYLTRKHVVRIINKLKQVENVIQSLKRQHMTEQLCSKQKKKKKKKNEQLNTSTRFLDSKLLLTRHPSLCLSHKLNITTGAFKIIIL
jgi:hypothetical protein